MHDVVIYTRSAKGEGMVPTGTEGSVLFADALLIDGNRIHHPKHPDLIWPEKDLDFTIEVTAQGFVELWILDPPEKLFEYPLEKCLDGTSKAEGKFGVPVKSLRTEQTPAHYFPTENADVFVGEGLGEGDPLAGLEVGDDVA